MAVLAMAGAALRYPSGASLMAGSVSCGVPYIGPFVAAHQMHLSGLWLNHPSENTFLLHLSASATESCVEKCHFKQQKEW